MIGFYSYVEVANAHLQLLESQANHRGTYVTDDSLQRSRDSLQRFQGRTTSILPSRPTSIFLVPSPATQAHEKLKARTPTKGIL